MSRTPVNAGPEGVEIEPHKIGHRWIDLTLAGSAILISVVSLVIAVKHGETQERLVAANSWPILTLTTGNTDDATGKSIIAVEILNQGAGPALLKHVTLTYEGKPQETSFQFLRACCDWPVPTNRNEARENVVITSRVSGSVIPAGGKTLVVMVPRTEFNKSYWDRLDKARFKAKFDACYCSVLGECWSSDLSGQEPERVKSCPSTGGLVQ